MDALDGKQGIRLNLCSPLETLFDHGFDSLSTAFISYFLLTIINFPVQDNIFLPIVFLMGNTFGFYCTSLSEYFTTFAVTNQNNVGVTEAQFLIVLTGLFTGIFGRKIWMIKYFGISLSEYYLALSIVFAYINTF